ncbi:MAG: hypothetical protein DRP61_04390 [Candidatus Omnitrophota bacterium]|nr:MAG: hypothetical protein DRP61_04390 [Candidatus Omnitrophota bacterium]
MYNDYWGFIKKPFENTLDSDFLYYSPEHKEALSRMVYVVREHKSGFFLVGDYGTGKTFLTRALIKELPSTEFKFALISNPRLDALELIGEIIYQLSGSFLSPKEVSKPELLHTFSQIVEENYYKQGLYLAIIIDEAQTVEETELLEELRLLLNLQTDTNLFSLLLLGQLSFLEKIEKLPSLKERLSIRFYLHPLDEVNTRNYIEHRLKVAGQDKKIFTDSAYKEIYSFSKGIPRQINNICDLALLSGFIKQVKVIDKDIVFQAEKDLEGTFSFKEEGNND